jgi:hypothetical protein
LAEHPERGMGQKNGREGEGNGGGIKHRQLNVNEPLTYRAGVRFARLPRAARANGRLPLVDNES